MKKLTMSLFLIAPNMVMAADEKLQETTFTSVAGFLGAIKNYMLAFLGALFTLFIVIGAVQFITSSGNPDRAKTARKTLTYAIIGLLAVLLSEIVFSFLTGELMNTIFGSGAHTL